MDERKMLNRFADELHIQVYPGEAVEELEMRVLDIAELVERELLSQKLKKFLEDRRRR